MKSTSRIQDFLIEKRRSYAHVSPFSSAAFPERHTMKITVERLVNAPIARVWSAYTTPADIRIWNTASNDWHTTRSEVNLRVGGAFSSRMEAKDGSFGFDFAGTYTKIEPQKLIEYTFGERTSVVEFLPTNGSVNVRVTFEAEADNSEEQQRSGWQAILDNFAKYVEAAR
jgi:uncharacterized protein YndB with AHSA1/START domain